VPRKRKLSPSFNARNVKSDSATENRPLFGTANLNTALELMLPSSFSSLMENVLKPFSNNLQHMINQTQRITTPVSDSKVNQTAEKLNTSASIAIQNVGMPILPHQRARNAMQPSKTCAYPSGNLPLAKGQPFSKAECILIIYFVHWEMPWDSIERKMGRTVNCCCSKYSRGGGLKEEYVQEELEYSQYVSLLNSLVSRRCSMLELFKALEEAVGDNNKFVLPKRPKHNIKRQSLSSSLSEASSDAPGSSTESENSEDADEHRIGSELLTPRKGQSSSATLATESSEGPRLRHRGNIKRYTFTEADFGPEAQSSPESSTVDAEADSEDKNSLIRQNEVSGSRACFSHPDPAPGVVSIGQLKPYLRLRERALVRNKLCGLNPPEVEELGWNGAELHIPLSAKEIEALKSTVAIHMGNEVSDLSSALKDRSDVWLRDVAYIARKHEHLAERSRQSIEAFLTDTQLDDEAQTNHLLQLRLVESRRNLSMQHLLMSRELGDRRNTRTMRDTPLRDKIRASLQPAATFTGASGDVGTVAWSPDGNIFAAGSYCIVDDSSMQYNRYRNLLLGNFDNRTLLDLPFHFRKRVKPPTGPNSVHAMHITQDPRLFETVSMVNFSPDGDYLYSVGYDHMLRAYKAKSDTIKEPALVFDHRNKVDLLAVSSGDTQFLATGCQNIDTGVRIFRRRENDFQNVLSLSSNKAKANPHRRIFPTAMKWGMCPRTQDCLLVGFSSNSANNEEQNVGEVCVFDIARQIPIQISPSAGNIFDCTWSTTSPHCAVARTAASSLRNKGTKSEVLIFRPDQQAFKSFGLNLECPAIDINDVVFCCHDYNYVAAGATDGRVYVWDQRNPDKILHVLHHGDPCSEIDPSIGRDQADTGVRFTNWGSTRKALFTGSSDGVVKCWDIYRAPADAFQRDIASLNSGIMAGAFNKDYTRLLLGEVNGSVSVLEADIECRSIRDMDVFGIQEHNDKNSIATNPALADAEDSGKQAARFLRRSKQIKIRKMGFFPVRQGVQGRRYCGPYDTAPDAPFLRNEAEKFQRLLKAQESAEECLVDGCREAGFSLASKEQAGDSGRSQDRIPQTLRDTMKAQRSLQGTMIPGRLKCSRCGRPARPRLGDEEQENFPLCEHCSFSCFRCHDKLEVDPAVTEVMCKRCNLRWRAAALGYTVIGGDVEETNGVIHESRSNQLETMDASDEEGDSLVDFYHSLWEIKPPEL